MLKLLIISTLTIVLGCEAKQKQNAKAGSRTEDIAGCWVNIYTQKNYSGNKITFKNSLDLPSLIFKNEKRWAGNAQSMWVGPNAEVSVYHSRDFKDLALQVKPDSGLDGVSGIPFSQIGSLKINCMQ